MHAIQSMRNNLLCAVLLSSAALGLGATGCMVQGRVSSGAVVVAEPTLVEVSSGVWVVEDYSEPVFYADNYYWAYRGNTWFRSTIHTGGWIRVQSAPHVVLSVGQPHRYVRYRGVSGTRIRQGPRGTVVVRDHRHRR